MVSGPTATGYTSGVTLLLSCLACIVDGADPKATDSAELSETAGDIDSADSGDSRPADSDAGAGEETAADSDSSAGDSGDTDSAVDSGEAPIVCDRSENWVFVAAGILQTCGVHSDGCAECWGLGEEEASEGGSYGYYGEDKPPAGTYSRIEMYGASGTWEGPLHACGVSSEEGAHCWGSNPYGECDVPVADSIDISVGEFVTYGLDSYGGVWGIGDRAALPPSGEYIDIAIGSGTGYARTADGTTLQWPIHNDDPAWVKYLDDKYLQFDAKSYACGVREDESIRCWHPEDPNGELDSPLGSDVPDGHFQSVCVSEGQSACALGTDGIAQCWGVYFPGMDAPTDVLFTQIACGDSHFCGITTDQDLVCWGYDAYGETITPT